MTHIRRSFTYANVMATVAVVVALGGGAYAATTLPKNSVKSKQIANGQVKGADIAANAVNSAKVADFSLLAQDFRAGQLPAGPAGPQGAQGPQGPQGEPGADGQPGEDGLPTRRLQKTCSNSAPSVRRSIRPSAASPERSQRAAASGERLRGL
jgi:hypothetical protein